MHVELRISLRIFEKIWKTSLMVKLGAWGKLIHEKNQKQKISWHCPFKLFSFSACVGLPCSYQTSNSTWHSVPFTNAIGKKKEKMTKCTKPWAWSRGFWVFFYNARNSTNCQVKRTENAHTIVKMWHNKAYAFFYFFFKIQIIIFLTVYNSIVWTFFSYSTKKDYPRSKIF